MRFVRHIFAHFFHPRRSNNHRPMLLQPPTMATLALLVTFFAHLLHPVSLKLESQYNQVLGYASNISATDVVVQTNLERQKSGLPSLKMNEKLNQAAGAKAQYMLDKQYWAHIAPDGTDPWYFFRQAKYSYRVAGENLARDFDGTAEMVAAWIASPTHKANIMNARYTEIGVAVVNGQLLGVDTTLVVQLFALPQSAQFAQKPGTLGVASSDLAAADNPETEGVVEEQTFVDAPPAETAEQDILGSGKLPFSTIDTPALFSPLQLMKAFFLAMILIIVSTLLYDTLVIGNQSNMRLVGHNLAHLFFLLMVGFLLIYFKAGVVG